MPLSNLAAAKDFIAGRFESLGAPGLAAGIVHGDELVWSSGYGVVDLDTQRAPDEATVARVASITKTFTATAILQLRDESKLGLDDGLSTHIPEFEQVRETGGCAADVTLRRLLTHYSGLSAETSLLSWGAEEFPGRDAVLAALPSTEVVIPADSQWKYSNLAFGLLGEVVTRLSGVPYAEYVREISSTRLASNPLHSSDPTCHRTSSTPATTPSSPVILLGPNSGLPTTGT